MQIKNLNLSIMKTQKSLLLTLAMALFATFAFAQGTISGGCWTGRRSGKPGISPPDARRRRSFAESGPSGCS